MLGYLGFSRGDSDTSGSFFIETANGDSPEDRFTISPNGNITISGSVGIGYTFSNDHKLFVYSNEDKAYVAKFWNDGNHQNRYGFEIHAGTDDGSGITYYVTCKDGNGTLLGGLRSSSGVLSVYNASDERIKRDISSSKIDALSTISSIDLIEHRYRRHGPNGHLHRCAFSAQNLKKVWPDAVSEEDDILVISQVDLIPILTKAIQEQQEIIEEMRVKIKKIEEN